MHHGDDNAAESATTPHSVFGESNKAEQPAPSIEGPSPSPAAVHTEWQPIVAKTAICDTCGEKNRSVLQRCTRCSRQVCQMCADSDEFKDDGKHSLRHESVDWVVKTAASARPKRASAGSAMPRKGYQEPDDGEPDGSDGESHKTELKKPLPKRARLRLCRTTQRSEEENMVTEDAEEPDTSEGDVSADPIDADGFDSDYSPRNPKPRRRRAGGITRSSRPKSRGQRASLEATNPRSTPSRAGSHATSHTKLRAAVKSTAIPKATQATGTPTVPQPSQADLLPTGSQAPASIELQTSTASASSDGTSLRLPGVGSVLSGTASSTFAAAPSSNPANDSRFSNGYMSTATSRASSTSMGSGMYPTATPAQRATGASLALNPPPAPAWLLASAIDPRRDPYYQASLASAGSPFPPPAQTVRDLYHTGNLFPLTNRHWGITPSTADLPPLPTFESMVAVPLTRIGIYRPELERVPLAEHYLMRDVIDAWKQDPRLRHIRFVRGHVDTLDELRDVVCSELRRQGVDENGHLALHYLDNRYDEARSMDSWTGTSQHHQHHQYHQQQQQQQQQQQLQQHQQQQGTLWGSGYPHPSAETGQPMQTIEPAQLMQSAQQAQSMDPFQLQYDQQGQWDQQDQQDTQQVHFQRHT